MRGLLYIKALRLLAEASREKKLAIDTLDTARQLGAIALEHATEVSDIARQLAIINTAEKTLADQESSFLGGLRPHQHPYLHDLIAFMDMPPSKITMMGSDGLFERYLRGALVDAPTGVGKTVLIARTSVALGVGRPLENTERPQDRVRALIIVPSQTLVEQLTGKVGDDTFRTFAPGIETSGYYEHEKNDQADAVVITIDQFTRTFRNGRLNGERFDICIIDECHHITEPLLQQTIAEHWHDGPVIGFTATPKYGTGKDASDILTHRIFHGDILDVLEGSDDVLNAAQLYEILVSYDTYLAGEILEASKNMNRAQVEQLVLREATADYLMPQIQEGRRGILFCEQGGGEASGYALKLASRLRRILRPDGTPLRVAVAGSINSGKGKDDPLNNTNIRAQYAAGELDFIVTVNWGREGLNEDIDSVTVIGTVTSPLKFLQEIGRGTRLSKRFPVTIYGHLFVSILNRNAQSLFSVLGFDEIDQGVVIGKKEGANSPPRTLHSGDSVTIRKAQDNTDGIDLSLFPERLRALIQSIHTKTVAEVLYHPDIFVHVPKGYRSFESIAHHVPGSRKMIKRHLRQEKGFACIGRYEENRTFVFYFEPAAEEYLREFTNSVARVTLQKEFGGVDVSVVDALAEECNITTVNWFHSDGKLIPHYFALDALRIREKFEEVPTALPTDYSRTKLTEAIGHRGKINIIEKLTREEINQSERKRTSTANGKTRVLDHWSQEDGDAIVKRIKAMLEAGGAPPHLLSEGLATRLMRVTQRRLSMFAQEIGLPGEKIQVARAGARPTCITWQVVRLAAERFGLRSEITFDVDFDKLPQNETDTNPEKIAYARHIIAQLQTLPPKH
jgi:superfamily II DNA or RNA helicase